MEGIGLLIILIGIGLLILAIVGRGLRGIIRYLKS